MSRLFIPFLNEFYNRSTSRIHQGRKQHLLFRSISVGNKSADAVWRGRTRIASTSRHNVDESNDPENSKSQQRQKPVTSSLLEEISRIQRRPPMLVPDPSKVSNNDDKNESTSPLSFFRTSQQDVKQPQQHLEQKHRGDYATTNGSNSTESLTKLLIETSRVGTSDHRPVSNIPLRSESSIFDVFQVPEAPQIQISQSTKRSPNAYPLEAVKQYYEILEPIVTSDRFYQKFNASRVTEMKSALDWLKADEPVLLYDLPTYTAAIKGELDLPKQKLIARTSLQNELAAQNERYCKHYNFSNNKSPAISYKGLFVSTSMCARYGKGLPAEVIWEKVKESGIYDKLLLQNLLYVSATFTTGSARSRRKRRSKYGHLAGIASILDVLDSDEFTNTATDNEGVDDDNDLVDIADEIAIFHDLLFEPSEQSINIRVKLLVAQGKAKEAEMLLDEHACGTAELRLRAYTPVLRLHIELNDFSSALQLFRKMKDIPTVHIDGDAYIHLIAGMAEKGLYRTDAKPIEIANELGYHCKSGPGLLDELADEMSKTICEIPAASARRLYNALASGYPGSGLNEQAVHSLKMNCELADPRQLLASRVRIDPIDGICPRSGVKLRLIHLTDDDKKEMVSKVLHKAKVEQHRQPESRSSLAKKKGDDHLLNFYQWLDQRNGRPFTTFIDGANVGYYHQNVEDGRFSFHQIKFMVDFLERLGENPLVILPSKYAYNHFNISVQAPGYYSGSKQFFTKDEIYIRDSLSRFGKIFYVPNGTLDDFYWIVSSVSSQTISRRGRDISVPYGCNRGQWPGARPVIITNDQMRDHQLDLLNPFLFRRWFSNYIVNYSFAAFMDGVCTHPDIGFTPADFFSREIQSSTDQYGSTTWHFPISHTDDEWFCCRIPRKNDLTIKLKPDESSRKSEC